MALKKRVYIAAPVFTAAERAWNALLAGELRKKGFDVILPQEETSIYTSGKTIDYAGIFAACLEGVRAANAVVAVFDGVDVDSGTAFECGYAYSNGIPIVGIRTDIRSGGEENGVNAMLSRCCKKFVYVSAFSDFGDLVASIIPALTA